MLDKSHKCASMYLSIILDRARYSPLRVISTIDGITRRIFWPHVATLVLKVY